MNETVVARFDDCPESRATGVALMEGVASAGLTVTVATLEVTVVGEAELSLTCSSKDHVPTVVREGTVTEAGVVHVDELPRFVKTLAPGAF